MEGGTFLDERIQKEFGRFVEIRLHNDHPDQEIAQRNKLLQQKHFGTIAMPYYVFADPTGQTIYWQAGGVFSADDFLSHLQSIPAYDPQKGTQREAKSSPGRG